jgi:hypothetical protein
MHFHSILMFTNLNNLFGDIIVIIIKRKLMKLNLEAKFYKYFQDPDFKF